MPINNETNIVDICLPLSVIIPTYNRGASIEDCVRTCQRFAGGVQIEFVVVDDGSSDDTVQRLEHMSLEMTNLKWSSVPRGGAGHARNVGAAMASHDIILFIGDDIRPLNHNFFRAHAELHTKYKGTDLAVLGKIVWPRHPSCDVTFTMSHIQGNGGEQFGYAHFAPYNFLDYRFFYTANISIKKNIVMDWTNDGFSKAFFNAGYEDIEFAYRLSQRIEGLRILYTPASIGSHYHDYSINNFISRQINAGMMAYIFVELHPEVAEDISVADLMKDLQLPLIGSSENQSLADYISVIEGLKSWARLFDNQFKCGSERWHEDLLSAVFELSYSQGFIMSWDQPNANLAAAYSGILSKFMARMDRAVFHEVTGNVLSSAFLSPWRPQRLLLSLRRWAERKPLMVAVAHFFRRIV
jgi:glycosyltransferase involved in cell wall biosynthesis